MYNYELLPKLTHLTLTGFDEDGPEFIGTYQNWIKAGEMEERLSGVELWTDKKEW